MAKDTFWFETSTWKYNFWDDFDREYERAHHINIMRSGWSINWDYVTPDTLVEAVAILAQRAMQVPIDTPQEDSQEVSLNTSLERKFKYPANIV